MKKQIALALALAAASFAADAGELSYSNIEAGYSRTDLEIGSDLDDATMSGFALRGSAEVGESFYLFGAYESGSDNDYMVAGLDVDLTQYQAGVGFHHGLSDKADFLAELSYVNAEVEVDAFGFNASEDVDGYRASVGFRGAFSEHFEGLIKANYTDGSDFDGEFTGTLGAHIKFNQTWGLVAETELGSDSKKYLIGVRASF